MKPMRSRATSPSAATRLLGLFAMALLTAACTGSAQPSTAIGTPLPSHASGAAPTPSPEASITAASSAATSSASVASGAGYVAGLGADAFVAEAESRGLTCQTYASDDPSSDVTWACTGPTADGSELLMYAQGPDPTHLAYATAEVLGSGPVEDRIVTTNLGPLSDFYAGPDGAQAQAWLLAALPAAQRDGAAETDIADNHYRLTFQDNGAGTASATYLLVAPLAPRPSIFGEDKGPPVEWVTFMDQDRAFAVALPGRPVKSLEPIAGGPRSPVSDTTYAWTSSDAATTYAIRVTDYPAGFLSSEDASAILPILASQALVTSATTKTDHATTFVGDHPGLDLVVSDPSGFTCGRFVIVGDRLHALTGTSLHGCPEDMAAFVGSFAVTRE